MPCATQPAALTGHGAPIPLKLNGGAGWSPIDATPPLRQGAPSVSGFYVAGITFPFGGMRVHRWLGLAIGLVALVVALSGAILVWAPVLDRIAAPAHYRVSGETRLAPRAYVTAARSAMAPGQRIASLSLESGSSPVLVLLSDAHGKDQRLLFLDPPTARVLGKGAHGGGASGWLRRLHDGLFLGDAGRAIVGVAGVMLVLLCLTGPWVRPRDRARRTARKFESGAERWHWRIGLWSLPLVLVMILTGTALAFPGLLATLTGEGVAWRSDHAAPPVERTTLSVERVVASARHEARGRLVSLDWPTQRSPDWTARFEGPHVVKVADDSATAVAAPERAAPASLSWVRRLHTARDMPWFWRAIASIAGLAAAMLAMTGLIGWATRCRTAPRRQIRRQTRSTRSRSVASRPKSSM